MRHLRKTTSTWRKWKLFLMFFVLLCCSIYCFLFYKSIRLPTDSLIGSDTQDLHTCVHPVLPVNNPEILKHILPVQKITCNGEDDWVENNGTHAVLTSAAKAKYGGISCSFIEIERLDDRNIRILSDKLLTTTLYKFESADFVRVKCKSKDVGKRWQTFLAAPRNNIQVPMTSNGPGNRLHPKLNVLIWGHDSLSRNMFIRKLPQTFSYLDKELKGHVLEGYNIVGDGTPQALIPILTGSTEIELPEARLSQKSRAHFLNDAYPFIWKDYKRHGYLTGYLEDAPSIGTFQYRLMGFDKPPVDYYLRPYYIAAEAHFKKFLKYCIGSIPRHKIISNYVRNIMKAKKEVPKFIFSFHSELSHDSINLIQGMDVDLEDFMKDLEISGILNNTVLIVMSDHGHRFSTIRETQQGKLEERLPFMFFRFPTWFEKVYPTAYRNFIENKKILTTPFDIHKTLMDILHMTGLETDDQEFKIPNNSSSRQMSLFRIIPENRTCAMAGIEPHWCACLSWKNLEINSAIVRRAAYELINKVNDITHTNRRACAELMLSRIISASSLYPKEALMKFKKSSDMDGRVPDLSDKGGITHVIIQITVETNPGMGHFEASLQYDTKQDDFRINDSEISRINAYGIQAHCVDQNPSLEHLRKYCFCIAS